MEDGIIMGVYVVEKKKSHGKTGSKRTSGAGLALFVTTHSFRNFPGPERTYQSFLRAETQ
jgi:hypothetical protein